MGDLKIAYATLCTETVERDVADAAEQQHADMSKRSLASQTDSFGIRDRGQRADVCVTGYAREMNVAIAKTNDSANVTDTNRTG
jgi:hypothetical protein